MRWLILCAVICFTACSGNKIRGDVMPPGEMKKVLFDIIRADEFATNFIANDSTKKVEEERMKLYEKVFVLHKTTHTEFFRSFEYYQQHPDINKQLMDSIIAYGKQVQDTVAQKPRKPVPALQPIVEPNN